MRVYLCDRCGRRITSPAGMPEMVQSVDLRDPYRQGPNGAPIEGGPRSHWELCHHCFDDVRRLLSEKPPGEA